MSSNEFADVERRLAHIERQLVAPRGRTGRRDRRELPRIPAAIEMYRSALALTRGDPAGAIARAPARHRARQRSTTTSAARPRPRSPDSRRGPLAISPRPIGTRRDRGTAQGRALRRRARLLVHLADLELTLGRLGDAQSTLSSALELADRIPPTMPGLRGTADMLVALSRSPGTATTWRLPPSSCAGPTISASPADLPQNPYRWRVAMARLRAAARRLHDRPRAPRRRRAGLRRRLLASGPPHPCDPRPSPGRRR